MTAHQIIEKLIFKSVVNAALHQGYAISLNDGEETTVRRSRDPKELLDAAFSTDEDYLFLHEGDEKARYGWIHFVYGNDGTDVISDYTTNLDELLDPINKRIEKLDAGDISLAAWEHWEAA